MNKRYTADGLPRLLQAVAEVYMHDSLKENPPIHRVIEGENKVLFDLIKEMAVINARTVAKDCPSLIKKGDYARDLLLAYVAGAGAVYGYLRAQAKANKFEQEQDNS